MNTPKRREEIEQYQTLPKSQIETRLDIKNQVHSI
jgi:hypothetical protein